MSEHDRLAPAPRLLAATGALFVAAALPAWAGPETASVYGAALVLLAAVATVDALRCARARNVLTSAQTPAELFVGGDAEVVVGAAADGLDQAVDFEARLEADGRFPPVPPAPGRLLPGESLTFAFRLQALRRGPPEPLFVRLWWTSPLGLWRRVSRRALGALPAVGQDVRPVREAARRAGLLLGRTPGLRPKLTPGEGSDFDALREFAPGHDRRALHWKASGRHRKLLVRDYRAESARHLVVAFDVGRLMTEPLAGVARFDHAARAALRLAYEAVGAGDLVGAYSFGAEAGVFLPPSAGAAAFRAVRAHLATLEPRPVETNFTLGLQTLATSLKRRTLVFVFTDFADPTTAELMIDHLSALARRHLVLFVALRDAGLAETAEASPQTTRDVARAATAYELVRDRAQVLARLRRLGVQTLDVAPDAATPAAVDRYLQLKRRERL